MKKLALGLAAALSIISADITAQNIYFSGMGRALLSTEQLTDKSGALGDLKGSGGYTALDLGIYVEPDEVLRANVILRQRNEFGGFFDNGTSLEFRQMQLEGLIAKHVKYELGDIYLDHTPYTLWNDDLIAHDYESKLFATRRDIAHYENFFVDNKWRMQGFNTHSALEFEKGIEQVGIRAYGGRTRPTDFLTVPDRYFYGGRLHVVQSDLFTLGGNVSALTDIVGTVSNTQVAYDNKVFTGDIQLSVDSVSNFAFNLIGEAGGSRFELDRVADSISNSFDDLFYDLGLNATYTPMNISLTASYRNVGYNFSSPMAQSRRMAAPDDISLTYFPSLNDQDVGRSLSFYDRFAQENNLYNQSISPILMNYFLQYDMVSPYGKATPNRKGLTVDLAIGSVDSLISVTASANLLSEVVSEGDSVDLAKRDFTLVNGGLTFNANQLLGWENTFALTAGIRMESSKRSGANPVDLSSSLIDLGLDIEVSKGLHLLAGAKVFAIEGTEMQATRNEVNQITAFTPVMFNENHNIYSAGLLYNYDKKAYFSIQANMVGFDNPEAPTTTYELNQLFMVFGVNF